MRIAAYLMSKYEKLGGLEAYTLLLDIEHHVLVVNFTIISYRPISSY